MSKEKASERSFTSTAYEGISICMLSKNDTQGGTAIIRMQTDSRFPSHNHPGWEQLYVISGKVRIGNDSVETGDYLFTNPGEIHAIEAIELSELLVVSEKGIEIIAPG